MRQKLPHEPDFDVIIGTVAASMAGLILPLLLIPVIRITGHSVLVEESSKWLTVFGFTSYLGRNRQWWKQAAVFGLCFGISESFLYLSQLLQAHALPFFALRFVTAVPMHALTASLFSLSFKRSAIYAVLSLLAGILLHAGFNYAMSSLPL